jgi:hypothetical protein
MEVLVCAATENSFGHALVLTLTGELILLELHPSIDDLADTADCLKRWLISRGWTHTDDSAHTTPED